MDDYLQLELDELSVSRGVLTSLVIGPLLFQVLIRYFFGLIGPFCLLFADNTKLGVVLCGGRTSRQTSLQLVHWKNGAVCS